MPAALFLLVGGIRDGHWREGLPPFDGGPGLRLCRFVNPEQAAEAVTRVGAVEGPVEQVALGGCRHLGQAYPAPGASPGIGHLIGGDEAGELIESLLDLAGEVGLLAEIERLVVLLHQGRDPVVIDVHDVVGLGLVGIDPVEVFPIGGITTTAPGHPGTLVFFLQHGFEAGRRIHQIELEVEPRLFRLFPQQGEALCMFRRGVGDAEGEGEKNKERQKLSQLREDERAMTSHNVGSWAGSWHRKSTAGKKLVKSKLTANNLGGTQRMFYELYKNMSSAGKKSNDVLIFIHGFAHSFDDELETIQQLKKIYIDNKYSPIENIIFVSWPSSITVFPLTYFDDKGASINAGHSLMRLFYLYTQFLSDVFSNPDLRPCNQKIHLMAHSMGNRVLQSMLYSLKKENIKRVIDQVLLLNADVSFRVFEDDENSFNKLPLLANRISIYVNKGDDILGLSQFSKNILTARLGKAGPSNVDKFKDVLSIIDCTKVKNDILTSFKFEIGDHWGYLSSSQVQKDILANLNGIDQTLIANRSKVKDYVFSIDSLS